MVMWNIINQNKMALLDHNGAGISYGQLAEKVGEFGSIIADDSSVKPLIINICTNTIPCIVGYISFIENGYTVMMIPDTLPLKKYQEIINNYRPDYIYVPETHILIAHIANNTGCRKKILGYMNYVLYSTRSGDNDICKINDSLALLLSTSGTTGSSKMVRISYKNIESNTVSIIKSLGIERDDAAITSLPCSYTYGLSVINTHIYVGATILVTDYKVADRRFWDFFTSKGGTSFAAVAYTYRMLMRMGFHKWSLPTLNKMTQAGEKLNGTVYEYLTNMSESKHIRFQPMYGQTEATARIAVMPYVDGYKVLKEKAGSVGKVIEGGEIIISDKDENGCGRIIYCGENVTMGYAYGRESLGNADERNGRLDTGDYGYVDKEGFLYICGRKDRYVKYAGKRIELSELECELEKEFQIELNVNYIDGIFEINMIEECNEIVGYMHDTYGIGKDCVKINVLETGCHLINYNGKLNS